jgi:hypothetical protein
MVTREEFAKQMWASMQDCMREAYVKDGRAFTETEVQQALYEMLKALSQGQTGGGPMVMGEKA